MKIVSVILTALCFASTAGAQSVTPHYIDALAWLDGCAALSKGDTITQMHMDTKCFEWGVKHCYYPPSLKTRLSCRNAFVGHLNMRVGELLAELPNVITAESDLEVSNYQNSLSRLRELTGTSDCKPREEYDGNFTRCHVKEAGLRWVQARRLARWAGLSKLEDND